MVDLVPCFITRRNFSRRFQRYEGSDPSGKKVNELSEHVTRCLGVEFYATIDENHRNFSTERLLREQVARIWS